MKKMLGLIAAVALALTATADMDQIRTELLALRGSSIEVQAAGVAKTPKWTWTTTVITNFNGTITRISSGVSTNGLTKTVCHVWEDAEVPFKWREKFLELSDDAKGMVLSDVTELWTEQAPSGVVLPERVEEGVGDDHVTEEISEIQMR